MRKAISRVAVIVIAVVIIVIVVGAAVALASFKSTTNSSTTNGPKFGGTLTIDTTTEKGAPGDPANVQEGGSVALVQTEVYEGLTAMSFNGVPVPDLATNWTVVSPTDYIFSLRQGVKFQDGTPFNASAVIFSFQRILNNTASPRYGQASIIANMTALSNYKVEFKLHHPSSDFLESLAVGEGIVSPSAVLKDGSAFGSQFAVGTGPYDFVSWTENQKIVLQANPNYWGPKPYIQTIIQNIVPDATTRALQLQTGQAQLVDLTPQEAQRLTNSTGLKVLTGAPNEFITISIDVDPKYTIAPLLNPLVRQAINYAINRSAIVDDVELGYAVPGIGPIPPSVQSFYNTSLRLYPANGNITEAKHLLAEAGYPNGFSVTILTGPFTQDYAQVTQVVASDLQAAGISATINSESFTTEAGTLLAGNGTWSLAFHDWGGIGLPDAYGMMGEFYSQDQIGPFLWNLQHIRDSNLTNMLNELGNATSTPQAVTLSNEIQTRILQQGYGAILYYPDVLQGVSSSVQNYTIHPNPWYGYVIFDPVIGAGVWLSTATGTAGLSWIVETSLIASTLSMSLVLATIPISSTTVRKSPIAF
jgi:peptide/nickel transport system substrate-binding protein